MRARGGKANAGANGHEAGDTRKQRVTTGYMETDNRTTGAEHSAEIDRPNRDESQSKTQRPIKENSDSTADADVEPETLVEETPEPLPLDGIFEILKNQRRRYTIKFLNRQEGTVTLSDLAEHVAAEECETTVEALSSAQRKRAYVGLYQCHLPKMDEMGIVDFNSDRGMISLGPNAEQLDPYFDRPDDPTPWSQYYLGLAAVNAAVFVGSVLAAGMFAGATTVAAAVTIFSFLGLAGVHTYVEHADDSTDD